MSDMGNITMEISAQQAMLCELYILGSFGTMVSGEEWMGKATLYGWTKCGKVALNDFGTLLEHECYAVTRKAGATISEAKAAFDPGTQVAMFVAGAGEELHATIVKGINPEKGLIELIDLSNGSSASMQLSLEEFEHAWVASNNFMATVSSQDLDRYVPHPFDLDDVEIDNEISEIQEILAEHVHEVWAKQRYDQGYRHGAARSDDPKETPVMVPYSALPEFEKDYDRNTAGNTIKLLKKLGYKFVKQ